MLDIIEDVNVHENGEGRFITIELFGDFVMECQDYLNNEDEESMLFKINAAEINKLWSLLGRYV